MSVRRPSLLQLVVIALLTGGVLGICPCLFQGALLSPAIYDYFPQQTPAGCMTNSSVNCTNYPGMYQNDSAIKLYGTSCAVWDQMPATPWFSYCPPASNWSHSDYNWCQQPWCYVDASCPDGVSSSVFQGESTAAYYSYLSCGSTSDCYTNVAWNASYVWPTACPYDPTGGKTYKAHKSGDCACLFQGKSLTSAVYDNWPQKQPAACMNSTDCTDYPGKYAGMAAIKQYGTTCGAWDQIPGTPWYSYCPAGSEWCHYDWNWCQQPWCYVNETCSSGVASSVFSGSDVAFYSYSTCINTPDCYTGIPWNYTPGWPIPPSECPFDSSDNNWHTAQQCPNGWITTTTTSTSGSTSTHNATTSIYLIPSHSAHMPELAAMAMVVVFMMQH